jgi:hypothetical protein
MIQKIRDRCIKDAAFFYFSNYRYSCLLRHSRHVRHAHEDGLTVLAASWPVVSL